MRHQVDELNRAKEDMQRQVAMLLRQIQSLEAVPNSQTKSMKKIKDEQDNLNKMMRKQSQSNANYASALRDMKAALDNVEDDTNDKLKTLQMKVQEQNKRRKV
jgi:chromosome segregation ATPase